MCLRLIVTLSFVWAFLAPAWVSAEDIAIASWNVRHLGHGDAKNHAAVAHVASQYDLLAVQEVMTDDGLDRVVDALETATKESWSALSSHRVGRGSYRERYAYIWRESRIDYVDGAVVYLDDSDRFAREPYAARFEAADGTSRWVMANVHILYGDSRADRVPELRALVSFWDWMHSAFPEDRSFILAGDFNLSPNDPAFGGLMQRAHPVITRGATTLSSINGRYANLYDNLFVDREHDLHLLESGIDQYPSRIGWTHKEARRHISDHAPVYIRIGADGPFPARRQPGPAPSPGRGQALETDRDSRAGRSSQPPLRGNRRSDIYHHPGCSGYASTAPGNRVPFESEDAAQEAGYRRARNCDWPAGR